jgi:hypothetical protein
MKKASTTMKKSSPKEAKGEDSPSQLIDARIAALGGWRGETLARVRKIIREADAQVVEEVKWRKPSNAMLGVPVWERDGIICTGETYKNGAAGAHSRRSGAEHVGASCRSPRPLSQETEERLSVVMVGLACPRTCCEGPDHPPNRRGRRSWRAGSSGQARG